MTQQEHNQKLWEEKKKLKEQTQAKKQRKVVTCTLEELHAAIKWANEN